MKFSLSLCGTLLLSSATLAIAAVGPRYGISEALPFAREMKARKDIGKRNSCSNDTIVSDLKRPTLSAAANSFCSSYLEHTVTVIDPTTIHTTKTVDATVTTTSTFGTYAWRYETTVILCATPSPRMQCNYPANPDDGSAHDLIATEVAFDGINTFQCQQRCLANSECKSFQFGAACEIFNKTIAEAHIKHNGSSTNLYFDRDCPQYQYVNYSHSKPVRYKKTDWDDTKPGCPAGDHIKRVPASQTPSELKTLPPNEISSICTCLVASVPTAVTKTIINSLILSAFTTETFTTTALTTVTAYPKNLISWTTSYSLTH